MIDILTQKECCYLSVVDKNYTYKYVSKEYLKERQIFAEYVIGSSLEDMWGKYVFNESIKPYIDLAFNGKPSNITKWFKFSPIHKRYYNVQYIPLLNNLGIPAEVAIVTTDFTSKSEIQKTINDQLYRDFLTNSFNKKLFTKDFVTMVKSKQAFQILYFDLDNFKYVNDTFGHSDGDKVLIDVVNLINKSFRDTDKLYRMGGDEFAMIISTRLFDKTDLIARAQILINNLNLASFNKKYGVGVSIGILNISAGRHLSKSLLNKVDKLMYTSKKTGKNKYTYDEM